MTTNGITIEVKNADALTFETDVLVLKHSQALYGLDRMVVGAFADRGLNIEEQLPPEGGYFSIEAPANIAARKVFFVGTPRLRKFGYKEIRSFASQALSFLNAAGEEPVEIAVTVHGVGYGLDEEEAFSSQLAGFVDGITRGDMPPTLRKITFIEFDRRRATLLSNILESLIPSGAIKKDIATFYKGIEEKSKALLNEAGYTSDTKAHVFVAMPFKDEMEDIWDYGIKSVVKSAGYLCERADLSSYTGDVMAWVKSRIKSADIVIADLTGANPNVYLEIGYAWGADIPTILIASDADELKFDVRGQRCLVYNRIKDLEKKLANELQNIQKA